MTTVIWIIMYLVIGFGAFWILNEEDKAVQQHLFKKFENHPDHVLLQYWHKTRWVPNGLTNTKFHLACVLALFIVLVWPIAVPVFAIHYLVVAARLWKKYST